MGFFENIKDVGARALEGVGIIDKEEASVSVTNGRLSHNLDLEGFDDAQKQQIEAVLAQFGSDIDALDEQIDAARDSGDVVTAEMLEAEKAQKLSKLTDFKFEIEHQQFNLGKFMIGNAITPGAGFVAVGVGFDGDARIESAMEAIASPEDAAGTGGSSGARPPFTAGERPSFESGERPAIRGGASETAVAREELQSYGGTDLSLDFLTGLDPVLGENLEATGEMLSLMSGYEETDRDAAEARREQVRV